MLHPQVRTNCGSPPRRPAAIRNRHKGPTHLPNMHAAFCRLPEAYIGALECGLFGFRLLVLDIAEQLEPRSGSYLPRELTTLSTKRTVCDEPFALSETHGTTAPPARPPTRRRGAFPSRIGFLMCGVKGARCSELLPPPGSSLLSLSYYASSI